MSYELHREKYWRLINGFIKSEISVDQFIDSYVDLWRQDRDEAWEQAEKQGRPDMAILDAFKEGKISADEFEKRLNAVFHIEDTEYLDFLDSIFTACNQYTTDPELLAQGYYTEEQLREYVVDTVASFREK